VFHPSENNGNKSSHHDLLKTNRALRALSECNEAVIRATDESEFIHEICRIVVEIAGYRLAWIGFAQLDEIKSVSPVASWGYEEGYLETLKITWAGTERGRGPTGTAIRTRQPCIARNIQEDPNFEPWPAEARRRSYASSVALPFSLKNGSVGTLNVYAPEPDAFDDEELNLLSQLAVNISHGLEYLHTQRQNTLTQEMLRRVSERAYLYLDIMGHDVANMLQGILLGASILKETTKETDTIITIDGILNRIDKCVKTISKVRNLEHMFDSGLIKTPLVEVLDSTIDTFLRAYPDVTVMKNYSIDSAVVKADQFLERALFNVLENAAEHNPSKSKHVWISLEETDESYVLTIADNGPGISDDLKRNAFNTTRRFSGIGLHVTGQIVEKYGGYIKIMDRVKGDATQGTVVRIWLSKACEYDDS
jgi:signal transduction histidine kinase